jgi:hypothetical protein
MSVTSLPPEVQAAITEATDTLSRLANIADTAASLLHKSSPKEAKLFRKDSELARGTLQRLKAL